MKNALEWSGRKWLEVQRDQNQLLHAIFSMTELQARITLAMVMYGTDFDYAVAAAIRLCPKN